MKRLSAYIILFICLGSFSVYSQTLSPDQMQRKLDSLSQFELPLNNNVQLNVSGIPLAELLNSLGLENNLNLSVDPKLTELVSYNFFDAKVKDVFTFLYKNYDVDIQFIGSIIAFKKRPEQTPTQPVIVPKIIGVNYNSANKFLSLDLKNDSLDVVAKEITKISGNNIVLAPDVKSKLVSGYFMNRPFEEVIDMLARSNGLTVTDEGNGLFYLGAIDKNTAVKDNKISATEPLAKLPPDQLTLTKNGNGLLDIKAINAPISDLIKIAAEALKEPYFMYTPPTGNANFTVGNISFEELLERLLNGTKFSYKKESNAYLIGDQGLESLRITELIRLDNRTLENVKESIPKDLTEGLEIHEFIELNGFVVSGARRRVTELKDFLFSVDEVVPMVQIDIIILYSEKGNILKTGISAGLNANNQQTTGLFSPNNGTPNVNLNSSSINNILNTINGFGILNLGKVTADFFLSLEALESNNIIEMESTPKISTLNGHEAKLSVGETSYYQQQQVQVQNVVGNANVQSSKVWISTDAKLDVTIKPFVSADENVTLQISVTQAEFGTRVDPTAPPDKSTKSFESLVRVKNGEVILMGGLEKKTNSKTSAGLPLLSRIPILKWIFSSQSNSKDKNKLHILIRPTVTY